MTATKTKKTKRRCRVCNEPSNLNGDGLCTVCQGIMTQDVPPVPKRKK